MAHETGTATDENDFLAKLKAFLTGNAALVAAGQAWTVAWQAPAGAANTTDVVLRGPGLSGQDRVFVGVRLVTDPSGVDNRWIELLGMTGVLAGATSLEGHVNVQPADVRMFLDDGPMTYWFTASGRRFLATAKISTVFESMYAGLFLPYSDPVTYPYPLFVGGSAGDNSGGSNSNPLTGWRSVANGHRHFASPYYSAPNDNNQAEAGAWMLSPSAEWLRVATVGQVTNVTMHPESPGTTVFEQSDGFLDRPATTLARMGAAFDDEFALIPLTLIQLSPTEQQYGILDGAYRVPGNNNSSENIVTADGVDHLVVQNVFRTGAGDYWAMALENLG